MFALGFLFGLGFDTATEIGLLGISASQLGQGMPIWSMLVFPALFTAGMVLVDTTDGAFMVGAYGWAFANPIRKLWYNLTITAVCLCWSHCSSAVSKRWGCSVTNFDWKATSGWLSAT